MHFASNVHYMIWRIESAYQLLDLIAQFHVFDRHRINEQPVRDMIRNINRDIAPIIWC